MSTYSPDRVMPNLLRCDRCRRIVASILRPYTRDAVQLTAHEAAQRFPELVNDLTVHELECQRKPK